MYTILLQCLGCSRAYHLQAALRLDQGTMSRQPSVDRTIHPPVANALDLDLDPPHASISSPSNRTMPEAPRQKPRHQPDQLPEALIAVPLEESDKRQRPAPFLHRATGFVQGCLATVANTFGIWREYEQRPTFDPDAALRDEDFTARHLTDVLPSQESTTKPDQHPSYWPFPNQTIHAVMKWLNNGNTSKSEAETTKFVHDIILTPSFKADDLIGFNAHQENQRLDKAISKDSLRAQFQESTVEIQVPSGDAKVGPKPFAVPGLLHRKLTTVILEAFNSPLAHLYHLSPFTLFHTSPTTNLSDRIHSEIYTSDSFLEETRKVRQDSPVPPDDRDCTREKVVAAIMFASDETHLTDFGIAKAWPIYLMLGNLTKYLRSQPNSGAMHHLAYIPSASFYQIIVGPITN